MQKKKRTHYTAEFKAKVVKEMLKEEKTVGQLATEYGDLHPKLWRPQTWGLTHLLFVHERTHVVQSRVSPVAIIETLDVLKRTTSGLCPRLKGCLFDAFAFETMEETLHRRIIVAVGSAAHATDHAFLL